MRRFLPFIVIVSIAFALVPLLRPQGPAERQPISGLPWQVDALDDGTSRVFGVQLGRDDLAAAQGVLGLDRDVAILRAAEEAAALEMHYPRHTAGLLSGTLVLVAEVDEALLDQAIGQAPPPKILQSGVRKYEVPHPMLEQLLAAPISSITFVPAAQLDDEVIRRRFGEPAEIVARGEGAYHYLYPHLGLDLQLYEETSEVLQYVPPRDFAALRAPLQDQPSAKSSGAPE